MGVGAKIVGVGSRSTLEEKQELLSAGSDDYVSKPIHPAKYVAWLKEIDETKWKQYRKVFNGFLDV